MIDNRRQAKINAVMAAIVKGLAYDQHINASPVQISIGLPEGRGVIPNCILVHNAPEEVVRCLVDLEEMFPGVEVRYGFGGAKALIDCEHVVIEPAKGVFARKLRQLIGGTV